MWSLVAVLADANLYPAIPDVLDTARSAEKDSVRDDTIRAAAEACRSIAEAEKESGDLEAEQKILKLVARIESGEFTKVVPEDAAEASTDVSAEAAPEDYMVE